MGGRNAQLIAREHATNVDLVVSGDAQLEIAVARGEVPLVAEIVIQTDTRQKLLVCGRARLALKPPMFPTPPAMSQRLSPQSPFTSFGSGI